jgi:hypothetical protein
MAAVLTQVAAAAAATKAAGTAAQESTIICSCAVPKCYNIHRKRALCNSTPDPVLRHNHHTLPAHAAAAATAVAASAAASSHAPPAAAALLHLGLLQQPLHLTALPAWVHQALRV